MIPHRMQLADGGRTVVDQRRDREERHHHPHKWKRNGERRGWQAAGDVPRVQPGRAGVEAAAGVAWFVIDLAGDDDIWLGA